MASKVTKIIANFSTQLSSTLNVGATTGYLKSPVLDKDGVQAPNGTYVMCIELGESKEEHLRFDLDGTTGYMTNIKNVSRQGVETDGVKIQHRTGAKVSLTDYANLLYMSNEIYTLSNLIDQIVGSGAPDATTLIKGVVRLTASSDTVLGTATISIATPAVITKTAHGLTQGDSIKFSTTGSLPTGIVAGQIYYVMLTGLTTDTFQISETYSGSAVNTSGSQSGVHTITRTTPRALGENDTTKVPTSDQKSALNGSQGTPSATNKYLTEDNASDGGYDQGQITQNAGEVLGEANTTLKKRYLAQSFVPTITKIRGVKLYKYADSGSFTGSFICDLATSAGGSPIATGSISNSGWLKLGVGEFELLFATEYSGLNIGQTYYLTIYPSTADNTNHPNIGINSSGGYSSGKLQYWNTTDGWLDDGTADLYFKTLKGGVSQIIKSDSNGKLPSNFANNKYASGVFNKSMGDASTVQTIAHGMGVKPKNIRFTLIDDRDGANQPAIYTAFGNWNESGQRCIYTRNYNGTGAYYMLTSTSFAIIHAPRYDDSHRQEGLVSADATNIYITWTKTGSPSGSGAILWEAEA